MITDIGFGIKLEVKETKTLGKILIMDNCITDGINRRQILNGRRL